MLLNKLSLFQRDNLWGSYKSKGRARWEKEHWKNLKISGKNYGIQVFSHKELLLYEYNLTNIQYCYFITASELRHWCSIIWCLPVAYTDGVTWVKSFYLLDPWIAGYVICLFCNI